MISGGTRPLSWQFRRADDDGAYTPKPLGSGRLIQSARARYVGITRMLHDEALGGACGRLLTTLPAYRFDRQHLGFGTQRAVDESLAVTRELLLGIGPRADCESGADAVERCHFRREVSGGLGRASRRHGGTCRVPRRGTRSRSGRGW